MRLVTNKFQRACKAHHVATSLLKPCLLQLVMLFAGLLQLVESTDNKPVDNNLDNQLATSLYVDNFNRPVVNKLSRAMRTHHDIDLLHQSA